ncbi:hypothetical protein EDD15DRAFT_2252109 [Pisolithus albus]|nr:hypothetical protein EDD15DRAFT_2252109 [Pisolithus albus]
MSLYSLVGNKLHLQLQRLVHLRPPAPILTAFVLLTSVPFLCAGPSTFASGSPLSWWRRLEKLDLTSDRVATLFQALVHALTTACLRIRITVRLPDLRRCLTRTVHPTKKPGTGGWQSGIGEGSIPVAHKSRRN